MIFLLLDVRRYVVWYVPSHPQGDYGGRRTIYFVGIETENWIPVLITRYPLTIFQLLPPLLVG